MKIVEKIEQIKAMCQVSYETLFQVIGICSATYRRWKSRIANALAPVRQSGPKPVEPLDLERVHNEMEKLEHKAKRSHGVGELRENLQDTISRRDLDQLIAAARQEAAARKKAAQFELDWFESGTVWAMDVFEMKLPYRPRKWYVLTVQDLATGYKFPPLATEREPRGHEVAAHLESLFARFGRPLFLKIDNGGNLNHYSIKQLLAAHGIIPLNSPAYYAPYNGAIEHTQGEFKERLQECYGEAKSFAEFALMAELAAHDLNHSARRKLNGKNSCLKFFGKPRIKFSKRKRKEVFEWISDLAIDIVAKSGQKKIRTSAWRVACRKWLEENGLVSIRKMQRVLPSFS
jgi:transposase InsO family protein